MADLRIEYKPEEWTPCPENCAYCFDPYYGHPRPHPTQRRILDNKTAGQVEMELNKSPRLENQLSS